ncbi:hypothetical protein [Jatrophihabitans fulvus]
MTDFEDRLKQLLNEDVDARLGPQRPAPPMRPSVVERTSVRRRTRWLPPLLAAACIAVVAVGGVAGAQWLSDDRNPADPIGPTPTVGTSPAPEPTPSSGSPTARRPADTKTTPRTSSGSTGATPVSVRLGRASVALPSGWVGRPLSRYETSEGGYLADGLCLTPASTPVKPLACPVLLQQPAADGQFQLDVDNEGGFVGNPHPCGQGPSTVVEQSADKSFGRRTADYRRWTWNCTASGVTKHIEQYVVATAPAYVLYSEDATPAVSALMREVAAASTLPAQNAPVRLTDHGVVRSIARSGDTVRITLDRTVRADDGRGDRNENPETYAYTVPASVFGTAIEVGTTVQLQSNGRRVTSMYPIRR